ncbi:MAG: XdhC family protein [Armatimonadetes bacterium]|nr:XdhC family protein [Armatimonadota bacterium]
MQDFLERAYALRAQGKPFAVATVVRAERPASARPGMRAIILPDGTLEGWVGGSCAHPVAVREALHVLREGTPRLIRLSPRPDAGEGVVHHLMTCHSGGTLEIYIESFLPDPQLLVIGQGPLAETLVALGKLQGFDVWVAAARGEAAVPGADVLLTLDQIRARVTPHTYVVVATMSTYDEDALEQVVGAGAAYVGLVASRKRAEAVFVYLGRRGTAAEHLQQVKVPAGLDIGAVTPEEIAASIIAEIIQARHTRRSGEAAAPPAAEASPAAEATDPICGMRVEVATARHASEYQGVRFYFCCAGCRETFERDPGRYAAVKM